MNRRWHRLVPALLVLTVAAGACGDDDEAEPAAAVPSEETVTVTVKTFDFQPDPVTVERGTKITFVNDDAINHTVTAGTRERPTPDVFDGELADKGATFELELDEPGTYDYFCEIHPGPGMTASITVE